MYTPRLGVLGLHKRAVAAVAAVGIVALLALAASMALMQPATVAPKGGTAENLGLKGIVDLTVKDAQGNVKYRKTLENTIQQAGYQYLLKYSFDTVSSETTWFDVIKITHTSTPAFTNNPTLYMTLEDTTSTKVTVDSATKSHATVTVTYTAPASIKPTSTTTFDAYSGAGGTGTLLYSGTGTFTEAEVNVAKDVTSVTVTAIDLQDETTPIVFSSIDIPDIGLSPGDTLTITWTIYAQAPT
jgi:hypothetical protein